MCSYERYVINDANLYQTIFFESEKKVVFRVILGNACVSGENLVPIMVPDICCLILKIIFLKIKMILKYIGLF